MKHWDMDCSRAKQLMELNVQEKVNICCSAQAFEAYHKAWNASKQAGLTCNMTPSG